MDRIEVKFAAEDVDAKTGEFAGYASVFGNIDSHGDVVAPGAFSETLSEWAQRSRLPAMKLMHGTALNPFSGDNLPIGKWLEMREDARGLYAKGQLAGLDTDYGRRIHGLMKLSALDGLSIGYKARRATRLTGPAKRQLDSVTLIEVSLVDDPSNERARLHSVKAAEDYKTIREFEEALINGTLPALSAKEAKALLAGGFKAIRSERDAGEVSDELAEIIRRNTQLLSR